MPRRLLPIRLAVFITLASSALAQSPSTPPTAGAEGTIRIWGHGHRGQDYILTLLRAWQSAFIQSHPGTRFVDELTGNASGLAGMYTNVADLALLDREASFIEVDAYQQGAGYDPFRIPVAMGAVSTPHHAPAIKIFVNKSNPLTGLTMAQLDGIFDADHRRADHSIRTWGDLGLTGPIASHQIHVYTYPIQSAEIQFFERAALKGSQKFGWGLHLIPTAAQIAAATARDPDGLALTVAPEPALKPLPIDGALPTAAAIQDGSYPLARTIYLYANRKPKSAVPPNVAAFLDFIVSPEGQAIVARTGGYLPLPPDAAAKAREALQ
ncbi:PstS family phosphate ABC transporter substrate-binding protein [Granulicella tundricola]|uniref:Phosphate-binding protein of an ABC transporter n=1 Tax=Granulicella tundricola (strain ATCC BAA-1859 / DSM 23138 / MP5ACTX9) TaxID=1198114 RepID=E8WY41_GRATM|nr:substrate-binding domain-containing protein [Granulicella tundricola]ADW67580.1 phosphate-binding protein of an ABC transporter [Granulicella tundricola MP5ACTX9]